MEGGITNTRTPLLSKEVVAVAVSGEDTAEQNGGLVLADNGVTMVLALATLAAVSGFYAFGNIIGYSSPAEDGILSELGISSTTYSVFGSMMNAGGLLGALCSGKLADLIGRKGAMWVTDITCILGWLGIAFAENAWMLDIGRLFVGFGVGIVSYAAPVYIAEVTPTNLRGTLAALNVLMSGLGISMFSIVGVLVNWRILALLGIIPCLLQFMVLFLVPESPRWLANMGRRDEVETVLQQLRGKNVDVSTEASDIEDYTERLQGMQHQRITDLFQQKYAYAFIVGVGTMTLQQLSGVNGYCFYMSSILEKAGASASAGITVNGVLTTVACTIALLLMDKYGRRPLLLISLSGTFLGNCLTGLSFFFQDYGFWTNGVPTLNFIGVSTFIGFYAIGIAGIPLIIMAEIFPINVKGAAGSMVNLVSWGGGCLASFTFPYFFEWSSTGVFFVFSSICFVGIIFVAKLVPETKGRSLEEIQESMSRIL